MGVCCTAAIILHFYTVLLVKNEQYARIFRRYVPDTTHFFWAIVNFISVDVHGVRTVQAVCELGRETINTSVYVQMDASECHVMTDNLASYTLTGEPRTPTSKAVKILRLAAFAPHVPTSVDFNLRVYFVEDTQDALEVCSPLYCVLRYD